MKGDRFTALKCFLVGFEFFHKPGRDRPSLNEFRQLA